MSQNEATLRILQIIDNNKKIAKKAERDFDYANIQIQSKANQSINLFGGDATKRVVEIASDAKRACDDLYVSYQVLVKDTDKRCKAELDGSPEAEAIGKVAEFIKWLNEESEIENNFSASLNTSSLGNVASAKYFPSIENKMIQKEWENLYNNLPEVLAKKEKEELERQERQKRIQDEKDREKRELIELKSQYDIEYNKWVQEKISIEALQEKLLQASVTEREAEIIENYKNEYEKTIEQQQNTIAQMTSKLNDAKSELSNCGLFAFSRKKELNDEIKICEVAIQNCKAEIVNAEMQFKSKNDKLPSIIDQFKRDKESEIKKLHPIPTEPVKPARLIELTTDVGRKRKDQILADIVYDFMEDGKEYTISEIHSSCPELKEYSGNKVSAILRYLRLEGRVTRTDRIGRAYYRKC